MSLSRDSEVYISVCVCVCVCRAGLKHGHSAQASHVEQFTEALLQNEQKATDGN